MTELLVRALVGLGIVVAASSPFLFVYRRAFAPWIARPVAEHVERYLEDKVIAIVVGSPEVIEAIQEQVTAEMGVVITEVARVHQRLDDEVMPRLRSMERKMDRRRKGDP